MPGEAARLLWKNPEAIREAETSLTPTPAPSTLPPFPTKPGRWGGGRGWKKFPKIPRQTVAHSEAEALKTVELEDGPKGQWNKTLVCQTGRPGFELYLSAYLLCDLGPAA